MLQNTRGMCVGGRPVTRKYRTDPCVGGIRFVPSAPVKQKASIPRPKAGPRDVDRKFFYFVGCILLYLSKSMGNKLLRDAS